MGGHCLSSRATVLNAALAALDGIIATVAFLQLLRLYLRSRLSGCNRQKVFHWLVGVSNLGYLVYFVLTPIANCAGWQCWSHACGFIVMALPQIVFLATFLLLLSFWVDLCHQATDREDDEDEDEQAYTSVPVLGRRRATRSSAPTEKNRKCCPCCRCPRIRSRQKFVIVVVVLICILTATFAVLIWIGMGKNSINSVTMAQIYSDIFAVVILISGGGLAGYGLLLYHKMKRVRSGRASRDIRKVAGLAVVSVVCFSLRACIVLFTDMPALDIWRSKHIHHAQSPVLIFLYYFIGESIPSFVVLWVMREMPSRPENNGLPRLLIDDNTITPDHNLIQQWIVNEDMESSSGVSRGKNFSATKPQVHRDNPG